MSVGNVILNTAQIALTVLMIYFCNQWFHIGFFETAIIVVYGCVMLATGYLDGLLDGVEDDGE